MLLVFVVVIVGIYGGWANPTEAAAIGAAACGILAVASGGMRAKGLIASALGTAQATAMIFLVLLGADMLNTALALSQMPVELAAVGEGAAACSPLLVMVVHPGDLHLPGLRDGQPGDDPADHPDLLSDDHGPRLLGPVAPGQVASGSASWR